MVWAWAKRLKDWLGAPELDWVQVELTTRCDARCVYCPHTVRGADWRGRDMPVELFRSLLPSLGQTRHVHLQGWGEPLLHPGFFEFVRLAKAKKCAVSTTSNGNLLDADRVRRLVESDVDVLGVSLAGTRAETNDALRAGTGLERLRRGLGRLAEEKERLGSGHPVVHLAYLNVTDAPEELAALPELARSLGVAKIMVNEPSPLTTPEIPGWSATTSPQQAQAREALYQELADRAQALGLEMFWAGRLLRESGLRCTENPGASCVVGVDGQVSPCMFGTTALASDHTLTFGDVHHQSLTDIWHSAPYASFRALFDPDAAPDWPAPCAGCALRGRG